MDDDLSDLSDPSDPSDPSESSKTSTVHSQQSSHTHTHPFPIPKEPLNAFKRRIELRKSERNFTVHNTIFPNYINYIIEFKYVRYAIDQMRLILDPNAVNALLMDLELENDFLPIIKNNFQNHKIVVTRGKVRDVTDGSEQIFTITNEHNRAHRGTKENYMQLKALCFWPNTKKQITAHIKSCSICLSNKYERHPTLQKIGETPILKKVGECVHINIFHIANRKYLTCVDKYSKFLQLFEIQSKANIPTLIEQVLITYPNCETIITDNEATFPLK